MTWATNQARNDEAADAAQFLSRFGYVMLALGIPTGAVLYELAVFVLYPVAIVSFVLAAILDPPESMWRRMSQAYSQPLVGFSLFRGGRGCRSAGRLLRRGDHELSSRHIVG